jgi:hypothetical protein
MNYNKLSIAQIAHLVNQDWKNVYFGAVPYLEAMRTMISIDEDYGLDTGKSVVMYFLSNAQTWRGETARAVKLELNKRLKQ